MSRDLACQVTTGRPYVLIAVLDSGIRWDDVGAMHDLARKVHINRGELPLPRDAAGHTKPESSAAGAFLNPDPNDLNDDGVFDVEFAASIGHIIQIAVGVRIFHVDSGMHYAVAHGEQDGGNTGGSQPNPNGTPAGTYTLTVTATSGTATSTMPLTLVVK